MDKVAWNFISAIYESGWNSLVTDKENRTFRQWVVSKFIQKIQETRITTKSNKLTNKSMSFVKLLSLILVKTSKEVVEISKFFKKGTKLTEKKNTRKLYTQALLSKTSKILKIKEIPPKLQVNKIENIYKIINGDSKSKPRLNMTTKDPSRKQVIIFMSNDNKAKIHGAVQLSHY